MTALRVTNKEKGFSLIELLVVIAIIAILLSILLPGVRMAKDKGKQVVCSCNQRQIATAIRCYAADWNDYINYSSNYGLWDDAWKGNDDVNEYKPDSSMAYWGVSYRDYTSGRKVFHCPAHKRVDDWPELSESWCASNKEYFYYSSYGLNGYISPVYPDVDDEVEKPIRFTSFKQPGQLILFQDHIEQRMDDIDTDMLCIGDGGGWVNLRQWRPAAEGGTGFQDKYWFDYDTTNEVFRHSDRCVVTFADGHIESVKRTNGENIPISWYKYER